MNLDKLSFQLLQSLQSRVMPLTRVATKILRRLLVGLVESIIKGEGCFKNCLLNGRCLGLLKLCMSILRSIRKLICNMHQVCAKVVLPVGIDQNSLHCVPKLSSLHKLHSYCKIHYHRKHKKRYCNASLRFCIKSLNNVSKCRKKADPP